MTSKKNQNPVVEYRTKDGRKAWTARGSKDHERERAMKAAPKAKSVVPADPPAAEGKDK